MSRIRSIKPEFWTSEQILECSTNARLLFIGLWNFCDDLGRHPYSAKQAKAEVFPADDFTEKDILGMLDELSANGLIVRYESEGKQYFYVSGWKHQRIDKPQAAKYPDPFADHSTIIPGTLPPDRIGEDRKGEERNISRSPKATRLTDEDFEKFKRAYPRRKGSNPWQPARKKLDTLITNGATTLDEVVLALQRCAGYDPDKRDTEYIPQAVKWLNDQRWRDVPAAPTVPVPINPGEREVEFFKRVGRWNAAYGPEPGQIGCRVPTEILAKFGYTEAA